MAYFRIINAYEEMSLEEYLVQYSFDDLSFLRSALELKGFSKLRKQATVEKLIIELQEKSNYRELLKVFTQNERKGFLTFLRSKKLHKYDECGRDVMNLMNFHLAALIKVESTEYCFVHPIIRASLIDAIEEIHNETKEYRNSKIVKAIAGIINTHGALHIGDISSMILSDDVFCYRNNITNIDWDIYNWIPIDNVYNYCNFLVHENIAIDEDFNFNDYSKFTIRKVDEFINYCDVKTMLEKNKSWRELSNLLSKYKFSKNKIIELANDVFDILQSDTNPSQIINLIAAEIDYKNEEDFSKTAEIVMDINNNTPLWSNRGAKPTESVPQELRILMNKMI